ncbi:MAG: L,D-transpeptidase [Hyphomicrobiaceae bacterium]
MKWSVRVLSVIAAIGMLALPVAASASVLAKVDISSQRMNVYVDGELAYSWAISSARKGYHTPRGSYRPTVLRRMHYSRKYDNSPMPHSVFFRGGYAIHGTGYVKQLGRPASHGCIRLHPSNAAKLFSLIKTYGAAKTRIVIQN